MYTGKTLFAQLMDFLLWTTFARIVERYSGDGYVFLSTRSRGLPRHCTIHPYTTLPLVKSPNLPAVRILGG